MIRLSVLAIAATLASPPDAESCNSAVSTYRTASDEVAYTLKRYASCIASSAGQDDCYTEFRRLKNAQDDFETAVTGYKAECS